MSEEAANEVEIWEKRTKVMALKLPWDATDDIITSQIRKGKDITTDLIAEWVVTFISYDPDDGDDGASTFRMVIDDSNLQNVTVKKGYMDLKRVVGGEPYQLFDELLRVRFKEPVTE